jgi:putative ABC transport system ATP-binding protein
MIEVREVTKSYGSKAGVFQALRGVSFTIPLGATVAIVGKSGSGKSTLMHLMGGLDRPTSGDIYIKDKPLGGLSRRAMDRFRARDLGFVFQSFFIEGNQTCYQNVALPLEINGTPRGKRKELVEYSLQQVGLFDKINVKARTLSGGQRQRLAIARAIVNGPRIIMADEPTGNLDSENGDKVIRLLFGLNRQLKSTLIIVTHDDELAARCQYKIRMKDGVVESFEAPAQASAARAADKSGLAKAGRAVKDAAGAMAKPAVRKVAGVAGKAKKRLSI